MYQASSLFPVFRTTSAVILLLPKAIFTPSIQPNLGLPRTRSPLTSAINTILAMRYSLLKNEMDLKIRKMTNHPPSPVSRNENPPHGDLVLSRVSIRVSPNLYILGMTFLFFVFVFRLVLIAGSSPQRVLVPEENKFHSVWL